MPVKNPTIPRVPLNGRRPPEEVRIPGADYPTTVFEAETPLLAEDSAEAVAVAADFEITIPILVGGLILIGLLYSAKYFLVPLLKAIKVPGSNFFSDFVNDVLGYITAPIKGFFQVVMASISQGIEAHLEPITRTIEAGAWAIHDLSVELANLAASMATAVAEVVVTVIPREINRATKPIRARILKIEKDIASYNAVAKSNGYPSFRDMLKVETPAITELRKAETYVRGQHHTSLAGALSTYETAAQRVKVYEETVRKIRFYDVPAWIRHITIEIQRTIPQTIRKLALRVGKIELKLKPNKLGIPELLAVMSPAAIAAFFRPAIPNVCTEVGDCAASNLIGKGLWQAFKSLLGLLLAASIDALVLSDLCAIANLARSVLSDFEPELRGLAVVTGGLASVGCGGNGTPLPPPRY